MLDALVVAPHPDDAELGMGGTIVRLIGQGWKVGILDLTSGEPTPLGSLERRAAETAAANAALGNPWRKNLGPAEPEPGADPGQPPALAAVFRQVRPRLLFAPYWEDAHPDHTAATKLVEDARFWSKLSKSDIPGDAVPPVADPLLLQRPPADRRAAELPARHLRPARRQGRGPAVLPLATRGQPARGPARRDRLGLDRTRFWGHIGRRPPRRAVRQPRAGRALRAGRFAFVRAHDRLLRDAGPGARRPAVGPRHTGRWPPEGPRHSASKTRAARSRGCRRRAPGRVAGG